MPTRTSPEIEQRVVDARVEHRRGQDWLGPQLGLAARTVSRILRRHDLPRLCDLDPLTGDVIRSRLAFSEVLDDERAGTTAEFFARAIGFFTNHGITIERVTTDNAWSHRQGRRLRELFAEHEIKHKFIRPHCPWQNGKVERFNRTLATEWAHRQVFTSNDDRTAAFAPWLNHYDTQRRHTAIGGQPPISRIPSPT